MYLKEISSLEEISGGYKAIICDIWGVLHNGVSLYNPAIMALKKARQKGIKILLLTNAPKISKIIQKRFQTMGEQEQFWDATVTSGDLVEKHLIGLGKSPVIFHFGPEEDKGIYDLSKMSFTMDIAQADTIICTGTLGDQTKIETQEVALLNEAASKKIPFICANPDKSVQKGEHFLLCAGSVADLYLELGGEVLYYGKPKAEIYEYCASMLRKDLPNLNKEDILAIGDGLKTDIRGAQDWGIDVLFIKKGLHAGLFENIPEEEAFTNLREICEVHDVMPEYVMDLLKG